MTKNELEKQALAMLEQLKAEGKNPHGFLLDVLMEMSLREKE